MKPQRLRLVLVLLGVLSVFLYEYAFAQPYNLLYLLSAGAPADLAKITGYAGHAAAFYVGAVSLLFVLYLAGVHTASRLGGDADWRWVLGLGLAMGLVLVRTYPYAATDLFLYIARGRVLGVHGHSSMALAPVHVSSGAYVPFRSEWMYSASPYGPLWEWTAALLARLGDGSPLGSMVLFKLFNLLCYAGCGVLIFKTLQLRKDGYALAGLVAFAWNPLVLLEGLAMGHNDLYMLLFVALAFWCWHTQRHTETLLALVAGGLVKYVPLVLLPLALIAIWHRLGWRRWLRVTFSAAALGLLMVTATLLPLWPGWRHWALRAQMYQGHHSVFVWLVLTLQSVIEAHLAFWISHWALRAVLVAGYLWLLLLGLRGRMSLADLSYRALLLYLVVGTAAFGYWYIAWLCLLVPLVSDYRQRLWTLILSWCGLMSVVIYGFVGHWLELYWPRLDAHFIAVPFVFVVPFVLSPWAANVLPPALAPTAKRAGEWLRSG